MNECLFYSSTEMLGKDRRRVTPMQLNDAEAACLRPSLLSLQQEESEKSER